MDRRAARGEDRTRCPRSESRSTGDGRRGRRGGGGDAVVVGPARRATGDCDGSVRCRSCRDTAGPRRSSGPPTACSTTASISTLPAPQIGGYRMAGRCGSSRRRPGTHPRRCWPKRNPSWRGRWKLSPTRRRLRRRWIAWGSMCCRRRRGLRSRSGSVVLVSDPPAPARPAPSPPPPRPPRPGSGRVRRGADRESRTHPGTRHRHAIRDGRQIAP